MSFFIVKILTFCSNVHHFAKKQNIEKILRTSLAVVI